MVANGRRRLRSPAADGRLDGSITASATTPRRACCVPRAWRPRPWSEQGAPERRSTMSRNAIRAAGVVILTLAACCHAPLARAGTTGKLAGRVTNEKKEPLAGVNIRVEGQRLGAISDDKGNYFILNIPGGSFTIL